VSFRLLAHAYLGVFQTEADIIDLHPDFGRLAASASKTLIVTAPGNTADFVSSYFAPPATASASATIPGSVNYHKRAINTNREGTCTWHLAHFSYVTRGQFRSFSASAVS
jgi:hypothetical protein